MITAAQVCEVALALKQMPGEAYQRAAIGRFYYAAFLSARSLAQKTYGYTPSKTSREHGDVATMLSFRDQACFRALRALRRLRNIADYNDEASSTKIARGLHDAEQLARDIARRLVALGGDPFFPEDDAAR